MTSIQEKLQFLPNLVKIEKCQNSGIFKERFILWFQQSLDHNGSTAETFLQRVEFGFNDISAVNVFVTRGYNLLETISLPQKRQNDLEIIKKLNSNMISVEYRYYGLSTPNRDPKIPTYFEFLHSRQAVEDFHNIYNWFKSIFKNKYIHTGFSKGGTTTIAQSIYHPEDACLFIPYVSVKYFSNCDESFLYNVYNNVGSSCSKNGKLINLEQYHKNITEFQLFLLKNKESVFSKLLKEFEEKKLKMFEYTKAHLDYLYSNFVIDIPTGLWMFQKNLDIVDSAINILTIQNPASQLSATIDLLHTLGFPEFWQYDEQNSKLYSIQSYFDEGAYYITSKFLIENLKKYCNIPYQESYKLLGYTKEHSEKIEKGFTYRFSLNDQEIKYLQSHHKMASIVDMENWYKNTKSNVILIYGQDDVWYSMRVNSDNNLPASSSILEYHQPGISHLARISTLPVPQQKQVWDHISKILK